MKKALKRTAVAVAAPPSVKPIRTCTREECTKTLTPGQKKFCSYVCRNIVRTALNGTWAGKYKPEYATTKFDEYIKSCKEGHEPTLIPTEKSYIVIHNAKMPTIEDYAEYLGIQSDKTLENWGEKHIAFARALDRLKRIQRSFLINNGLSGRYNARISQLMLGVNHGIIERKEVDNRHTMIGVVKLIYSEADKLKEHGRN